MKERVAHHYCKTWQKTTKKSLSFFPLMCLEFPIFTESPGGVYLGFIPLIF